MTNCLIALKFDSHPGSSAADVSFKLRSDTMTQPTSLAGSRLHLILRQGVLSGIETEPWRSIMVIILHTLVIFQNRRLRIVADFFRHNGFGHHFCFDHYHNINVWNARFWQTYPSNKGIRHISHIRTFINVLMTHILFVISYHGGRWQVHYTLLLHAWLVLAI